MHSIRKGFLHIASDNKFQIASYKLQNMNMNKVCVPTFALFLLGFRVFFAISFRVVIL